MNKALDITALIEDKREGQGAKENELEKKITRMENVIKELRMGNRRFLEKEEERQKKIEERRKIREAEAAAEREKNKSFFQRLFG